MAYLYDRSKNRIIEKLNISLTDSLSLSLYNPLPFLSSLPHLLTILVFIKRYPDGVSSYLPIKYQYNVHVCVHYTCKYMHHMYSICTICWTHIISNLCSLSGCLISSCIVHWHCPSGRIYGWVWEEVGVVKWKEAWLTSPSARLQTLKMSNFSCVAVYMLPSKNATGVVN